MIHSAGFLIRTIGDMYLLCHATNEDGSLSFTDHRWGVSKGHVEEGESYIQAAYRETLEEIGIDLLGLPVKVSKNWIDVKYKKFDKTLHIFMVDDPDGLIMGKSMQCSTYFNDGIPEVDSYVWLSLENATEICMKGQKILFDRIGEYEF